MPLGFRSDPEPRFNGQFEHIGYHWLYPKVSGTTEKSQDCLGTLRELRSGNKPLGLQYQHGDSNSRGLENWTGKIYESIGPGMGASTSSGEVYGSSSDVRKILSIRIRIYVV